MFNLFKKNNYPTTERCRLLKEKVLDIVEPVFFLGNWGWHKDTVAIYYYPQYNSASFYPQKGESERLSKKESKWIIRQAAEAVNRVEERRAQDLLEKLRSL